LDYCAVYREVFMSFTIDNLFATFV